MRHLGGLCSAVVSLLLALPHCQMAGSLPKTVCPGGLRGWTQVPLARAAWAQIPQLSCPGLELSPGLEIQLI